MKIWKHRRTIKPPKGSKGKSRPGVIEFEHRDPESIEELDDILSRLSPNPEENLEYMASVADEFISAAPKGKSGFIIAELGSPEHYAVKARDSARSALGWMEQSNVALAVRDAILATRCFERMIFAHRWEPMVAKAEAQQPVQPKDKRRTWGIALAKELVEQNPGEKFENLWKMIPEDEGNHYEGFEVWRDGDKLHAVSATKNDKTLKKSTFRTEYIGKAKLKS